MILTYSKEQFKNKIQAGVKIHTLRIDKTDRWKEGMNIQMWMHNPRNISKHPYCFNDKNICTGWQRIWIHPASQTGLILHDNIWDYFLNFDELAENDGFESVRQFWTWFNKEESYKIIHWTDYRY